MKVLLLAPSLKDQGGVAGFCRALLKNASPGFEIQHLEIGNRPGNVNPFRRLAFFFRDAARLRRSLKSGLYDLVHINPSMEILSLLRDSFYLFYATRLARTKCVVLFHGWNERLAGTLMRMAPFRSAFRTVYAGAGRVLALSRPFRDELVRLGLAPEKVGVVTTMFEADRGPGGPKPAGTGGVGILFMARLWESKGVYVALDVAKRLAGNGTTNFRLTIAGDGPELAGARTRADEPDLRGRVFVPGYLEGEAKRKALEEAEIFLYPSFYGEGCPVVLLEAMGAGLAVVSTPVAAIPEIIEEGVNGFLVDSRRAEDFAPFVERLVVDEKLRGAMGRANREKALENYEASVVTAQIESIYQEAGGA
jgi:glycosyltransferase involved in cell wall biosynthesis